MSSDGLLVERCEQPRRYAEAAGDVFQLLAFGDDVRLIAGDEHACRQQLRIVARGARLGVAAGVEEGDEIRTELSCKYTRESFGTRLCETGLALERWITDPGELFASALLRRV